jgi:hypothetical protein
MKKALVILIISFLLIGTINVFALTSDYPELNVEFDNNIYGEASNIALNLDNLSFSIDLETELTILFPEGFNIPSNILVDNIIIDGAYSPLSVFVNSNNNVVVKISPTFKNSLIIKLGDNCLIENPKNSSKVYFISIIFDNKSIIKSSELNFYPPENSITLDKSFKTITSSQWIPEEFLLKLTSSLAKDLYYSVDSKKFQIYDKAIRITNGVHIVSYYGYRKNEVSEKVESVTFFVDNTMPSVVLLEPKDTSYINKLETNLKLQIQDISPVVVIYKDLNTVSDENNIVIIKVILKPGENKIKITAIDSANHSLDFVFTLFVDITPPALIVLSPRNSETICGSYVEITGKVELGCKVMIQDYDIGKDNYGNFSFKYIPQKGLNKVTIKAFDKANNESHVTVEFYFTKNKVMEFVIGSDKALVEGETQDINPPPFFDENSEDYYLPLRFFAVNLSYNMNWNSKESSLILKKGTNSIIIKPYSTDIKIITDSTNGVRIVTLKNPPTIYKGSIMINTEFLKKIFSSDILYDVTNGKLIAIFCIKGE